jgi:hypothetical protein
VTLTMTTATGRSPRPQLDHVLLGSNPNGDSRFAQRTGRAADIYDVDFYEHGSWSAGCNLDRFGPATIGWIARQGNGGNPPLCGFIVCTGIVEMYEDYDAEGNLVIDHYVEGRLYGGLWIPGEDIAAAGWPTRRAPWGDKASRQFRNGESISDVELAALLDAVPDSTLRTIALEYRDVTGSDPSWA